MSSNASNSNDAAPVEAAGTAPGGNWFSVNLDHVLLRVDVRLERTKYKDRVIIRPALISNWITVFSVMRHGRVSGWSAALITAVAEFPFYHFLEGFPTTGKLPALLHPLRPYADPSISKLIDVELLAGTPMAEHSRDIFAHRDPFPFWEAARLGDIRSVGDHAVVVIQLRCPIVITDALHAVGRCRAPDRSGGGT
eukprot:7114044-Pyramimonas_sp.AAC.1